MNRDNVKIYLGVFAIVTFVGYNLHNSFFPSVKNLVGVTDVVEKQSKTPGENATDVLCGSNDIWECYDVADHFGNVQARMQVTIGDDGNVTDVVVSKSEAPEAVQNCWKERLGALVLEVNGTGGVVHCQWAGAYNRHARTITSSNGYSGFELSNAPSKGDRSVSLGRLGDREKDAGNLAAARSHYQSALDLREEMVEEDPHNATLKRELSISLERLGSLEKDAENLAAARTHFLRSLDLRETILAADPSNATRKRDLSISLERLGDLEKDAENLAAARTHFLRSLDLCEQLVENDPSDTTRKRDLSVALERLGDLEKESGNLAATRTHYQRCLELLEKLMVEEPSDSPLKHDFSKVLKKLGDLEKDMGNLAVARTHFERSLELAEKLLLEDPSNASRKFDVVVSHAMFFFLRGRDQGSYRHHLEIADRLLTEMTRDGQLAGAGNREWARREVTKLLSELEATNM